MDLEQGNYSGHGGQNGDALFADGLNQSRSNQPAFKVKFGPEDGRNPKTHGLPEYVAQWQRLQDAQGMDQPLVGQIGLGCLLNWPNAGQHISMGKHNALGIAGGA